MSRTLLEAGSKLPGASQAIVFEDVSLAFDDKIILDRVRFALPRGHTKIVLGASGAGKSTILRIILGLLKPDAGAVWINGTRVDQLAEDAFRQIRSDIGMVFQEGALFDSLTVRENAGYRLYQELNVPTSEADERVEEVLSAVGLSALAERLPSELSGGQRRRVAIARAIAAKPGIILYDEPTTGLDPITATSIDDEIMRLRDLEGASSLVVTHQMRDALYIATHCVRRNGGRLEVGPADTQKTRQTEFLMLRQGQIIFEGDPAAFVESGDGYVRRFLS